MSQEWKTPDSQTSCCLGGYRNAGLKEWTQEQLENDRRRRATAVASLRQSEHDVISNHLEFGTCHRSFRRKQDIERNNSQRSRDVPQNQREVEQQAQTQPTTAQPTTQLTCCTCARSFCRRQYLSRHKCRQQSTIAQPTTQLTWSLWKVLSSNTGHLETQVQANSRP